MDSLKKNSNQFCFKKNSKILANTYKTVEWDLYNYLSKFFFRSVSSFPPKPQESLLFSFGELLSNLMVYCTVNGSSSWREHVI